MGADLIVATFSHSAWIAQSRRIGFVPVSTTTRLFVSPALAPLLPQLSSIHLTRGDCDGPLEYDQAVEEGAGGPVMREDGALDEVRRLIGEAVKTDAASLTDDSSPETVATWDSATGMSLMVLLEETYGVFFEAEEIARLTSVGAIRQMLRQKGIAL
jgi:acyl carrier protein